MNVRGQRISVLAGLLILLFRLPAGHGAEVEHLRVSQVGNRFVAEYDLTGEEEAEVTVTVTVEGKRYTPEALHLEGDFGRVRPGAGKRIYWNVLQDFPRGLSAEVEMEVTAAGRKRDDSPLSMDDQPTFTPYEVAPKLIKGSVKLRYPSSLKKAGIEGTVILWILIDEAGRVKKVQVERSSGNNALDDVSVQAYGTARFAPAMSRDRPVKVWVQYPVQFRLN